MIAFTKKYIFMFMFPFLLGVSCVDTTKNTAVYSDYTGENRGPNEFRMDKAQCHTLADATRAYWSDCMEGKGWNFKGYRPKEQGGPSYKIEN